ncbi:selenocysteine-specific elongation factor-like [Marmota marmota marmota]|uniref:selenocysteine-specific elongation factor-like n=1 Tax=Marmota marmota marmota TaxID=9994 RepID=UPI002093AF92|nr:selenocysteine-specific elongation factor-like [Marmota marmota marmota]
MDVGTGAPTQPAGLTPLSSPRQVVKKVKSMQMFHTPVTSAMQGDRLGICVTQFDPKLLERGLVCTPESLPTLHAAIISVEKIPYFRGPLLTKAKFHVTLGHETVMGRLLFFSPEPQRFDQEPQVDAFDLAQEYLFQERYLSGDPATEGDRADGRAGQAPEGRCPRQQWALVEFERPVTCPRLSLVIGSRLDADIHANSCRLAFHGRLLHGLQDKGYAESALPALRVYKLKYKQGLVERVSTASSLGLLGEGGRVHGAPTVSAATEVPGMEPRGADHRATSRPLNV